MVRVLQMGHQGSLELLPTAHHGRHLTSSGFVKASCYACFQLSVYIAAMPCYCQEAGTAGGRFLLAKGL